MGDRLWWEGRKGKVPHLTSHVGLISRNNKHSINQFYYTYIMYNITTWAAMGGKSSVIGRGHWCCLGVFVCMWCSSFVSGVVVSSWRWGSSYVGGPCSWVVHIICGWQVVSCGWGGCLCHVGVFFCEQCLSFVGAVSLFMAGVSGGGGRRMQASFVGGACCM